MDVSVLHAATDELASYLSEATEGDLRAPTPRRGWTVGDLYRHLVEENVRVAAVVSGDPTVPPPGQPAVDLHGGGLEREYLRTARLMENAFASDTDVSRYETQVVNTVIHTWDLAQALGFAHQPGPDVADLVLRRMQQARGEDAELSGVLDRILALSGRRAASGILSRPAPPG